MASLCVLLVQSVKAENNQPPIFTNSESIFVYSLDSCITHLYKNLPASKQIPKELIVAQAVIETGWGKSRFANESNNLFGIQSGLKEFKTKCDSVADYIRIINEVPAYAEFREMRQDGITDALLLARTLKMWAEDPNYTDLIEDVIQHNIRVKYKL
jgi:Bax protein